MLFIGADVQSPFISEELVCISTHFSILVMLNLQTNLFFSFSFFKSVPNKWKLVNVFWCIVINWVCIMIQNVELVKTNSLNKLIWIGGFVWNWIAYFVLDAVQCILYILPTILTLSLALIEFSIIYETTLPCHWRNLFSLLYGRGCYRRFQQ